VTPASQAPQAWLLARACLSIRTVLENLTRERPGRARQLTASATRESRQPGAKKTSRTSRAA